MTKAQDSLQDSLLGDTAMASPNPAKTQAQTKREEMLALGQGFVGQYQGGVYLLPATDETVQWGWFNNAETPRARIQSGDTIILETMMASLNRVLPGVSIEAITQFRLENPGAGSHTITGPVFIEGAEPGDVLKVKINRIVPRTYGCNWNLPGEMGVGQFPDLFPEPQVKHFYLDLARGVTEFLPGIELPVRPFPGVLGVARAESGPYSTVPPGPYGGNLDCREMVAGTTVYFPVFVDGALLWSGDSHAVQGNGEINLTAVESAFNELNLTVEVIKNKPLSWPRIESATHWITLGYDRDLNTAITILEEETLTFLAEWKGMDSHDARRHMTTYGDIRVAEVVNQVKGVYCLLPKPEAPALDALPITDTPSDYVTHAVNADAMAAMNQSALALIERIQDEKGLTALDAYALASLALDARIGRMEPGAYHVHCLMPRSTWVS